MFAASVQVIAEPFQLLALRKSDALNCSSRTSKTETSDDSTDDQEEEEVSIKKISNRNIKSVMEAMLNAASTLFLACKFMLTVVLVTSQ